MATAGTSPPIDTGAIVVLGDAPGFVKLVAAHPQLRGRVVDGSSSGELGHTQFDRACAAHAPGGQSAAGGSRHGAAGRAHSSSYEEVEGRLAAVRAHLATRRAGAERARAGLLAREAKELEVSGSLPLHTPQSPGAMHRPTTRLPTVAPPSGTYCFQARLHEIRKVQPAAGAPCTTVPDPAQSWSRTMVDFYVGGLAGGVRVVRGWCAGGFRVVHGRCEGGARAVSGWHVGAVPLHRLGILCSHTLVTLARPTQRRQAPFCRCPGACPRHDVRRGGPFPIALLLRGGPIHPLLGDAERARQPRPADDGRRLSRGADARARPEAPGGAAC